MNENSKPAAAEGLTLYDYKLALQVQDACNLSGVVHSFSRVMAKIWVEAHKLGKGTEWANTHPIAVLYADKVAHLTGTQYSDFTVSDAYTEVTRYIEQAESAAGETS